MMKDPEAFIQEKLAKKNLSANTVRDLLMAAFLLILRKHASARARITDGDAWLEAKTDDIRKQCVHAFGAIGAPLEYPTREQLIKAMDALKTAYRFDCLSQPLQKEFEDLCRLFFSKFSDPF
ncbi:MAG: hypothetical protein ACE5GK_06870 [Nitrospiria bacterium]